MLMPKSWQCLIVAVAVLATVQIACGQQSSRVKLSGESMRPNFADGDIFMVEEVPLTDLKRGDLVLVKNPLNDNALLKRLVGLPGETVSIHDGKVYINGIALEEPYEVVPPLYNREDVKLDSDSYYVLGDNRNDSLDSHVWGPIEGSNITGKATPE
jgi:signal peptidase I